MSTVLIEITVSGPSGSGKTRAVQELLSHYGDRAKVIQHAELQGEDRLILEVVAE